MSTEDLTNRALITDVLYRYARGVDRKDWGMVRSCYAEDGYDDHGPYKGDADGLVEWMIGRHAGIEQSMHFIGNVLIELDTPRAYVESYCVVYQRLRAGSEPNPALFDGAEVPADAEGSPTLEAGARYVDRFVCTDGEWQIGHRVVVFEWMRMAMRDEVGLFGPDWVVATRGESDALYQMRRRV